MTLQQAAEIARPRKREAEDTKKKMERLRVEASDLYELVQDGRHDVDEALAALKVSRGQGARRSRGRESKSPRVLPARCIGIGAIRRALSGNVAWV
jgi:hypothetical protein